jgi:hypothetical protein
LLEVATARKLPAGAAIDQAGTAKSPKTQGAPSSKLLACSSGPSSATSLQEALELVTSREEAEAIVQAWDRDEPEQAGARRVEAVELRMGTTN